MTASTTDDATRTAVSDLVLEASGVGVVVFDADLRYVLVNDVAAEINGLPAEAHLDRPVGEVLPELAPTVAPVLQRVLDTGVAVFGGELVGETPARPGVERVWLVNYLPISDPVGRARIAVVFSEITDIRRAEQRLRTVMDSIFSFAGLIDADGTLLEVNRAALEVSGLDARDVIGRPFADAGWWAHDPEVRTRMQRAVADGIAGRPSRFDIEASIGADQTLTIDFALVPMVEDGVVAALIPSAIDITQRVEVTAQTAALADLAGRINQATSVVDVVDAAAAGAAAALGATFATVAVVDADEQVMRMSHQPGLRTEVATAWTTTPLDADTPVHDAVATRTTVHVPDDDARRSRYPALADTTASLGLGTTIAVPMVDASGTAIGAMGIAWTIGHDPDQRVVDQLATLADLVAQGIARTKLTDARVRLIRELQERLLPPTPSVPGLDIAVRYRPATEGIALGGDFYDVVALPSGATAIVVGDVVGHGVEAAAQMAMLVNLTRLLLRQGTGLEELPLAIDSLIDDASGFVATASVTVVDLQADRVDYVRLGHPPPLVRRGDGQVDRLDDGHHPVIGWTPKAASVGSADLREGEALVLYTDGLVERPDLHLDVAIGHAAALLSATDATTADEIADAMISLAPEPLRDDAVVAVCLRTTI